MNTYHVGTVYILFGKTPRSDSQNIIGVYQDEKRLFMQKNIGKKDSLIRFLSRSMMFGKNRMSFLWENL